MPPKRGGSSKKKGSKKKDKKQDTAAAAAALEEKKDPTSEGAQPKKAAPDAAPLSSGAALLEICKLDAPPNVQRVKGLLEKLATEGGLHTAKDRFKDADGATPLMFALCHPTSSEIHCTVVQLMMAQPGLAEEHCREVNTTGRGLLSYASEYGHADVIKVLLEIWPSVEHIRRMNKIGCTSLGWASNGGHTDVVKMLVEAVRSNVLCGSFPFPSCFPSHES